LLWPRRGFDRPGKRIQGVWQDIDRKIAKAQAQNGGGLPEPDAVTYLKL